MKNVFIVWGKELEHSRYLAKALDSQLKQIYIEKVGNLKLPVLLRYIWQGWKTVVFLLTEKPSIVVVQNPPVFAPLIVFLYCYFFKARFMIDTHTVFFASKKWSYFHWLFRIIARQAVLNTCHNFKNLEILERWNVGEVMVMKPYIPDYDKNILVNDMKDGDLERKVSAAASPVIMVNRFAEDDDWQTVVETAKTMPEIDFFITGNIPDSLGYIKENSAPNVHFTGYLEHGEFMRLMKRCKLVLSLTTRKDTILWSVGEAISIGKPVVTSDTEVLRHYFGEIAVFTKSDPDNLREAINRALGDGGDMESRSKIFLEKERASWMENVKKIKNIINNSLS